MLRTRRAGNDRVLFILSGRIETTEDIDQLQELIAAEKFAQQLILDLRDVTLVNENAVKFLRRCEGHDIKLENCPLHVRRWIDQVEDSTNANS
jgi:anti-anti-sigma regulatory factor